MKIQIYILDELAVEFTMHAESARTLAQSMSINRVSLIVTNNESGPGSGDQEMGDGIGSAVYQRAVSHEIYTSITQNIFSCHNKYLRKSRDICTRVRKYLLS